MPIYTYRCEDCGVQFEQSQKFTDSPLTRCPECGKKALRKVYLPVGIVFKGSGFYSTDHRSPSGGRSGAHGEEKSSSESESKSSSSEASSSEKGSSDKSSSDKGSSEKGSSDRGSSDKGSSASSSAEGK
jgi:putative FmdB family regulatory protein